MVEDDGLPDVQVWNAFQHQVQDLPNDVLLFLLASRYCEVDSELRDIAWAIFGKLPAGWPLVQAVCNFVHQHIRFDYMQARANRTALEVYRERAGVCRDYMHLAITFCRCLNIPARYCTGYLGDIGVPPQPYPDGFQRLVRSVLGRTMVRLRRPQQHAANRPHSHGPRPRRRRRGADDHVWREHAAVVPGVDRRSAGRSIGTPSERIGMNESATVKDVGYNQKSFTTEDLPCLGSVFPQESCWSFLSSLPSVPVWLIGKCSLTQRDTCRPHDVETQVNICQRRTARHSTTS